jgi:hypothetical protein
MNGGEKNLKNHQSALRYIWLHKSFNISVRENLALILKPIFDFITYYTG